MNDPPGHADEHHPSPRPFVLRVGLTGGIACGKSTVARHFTALGATVIDADVVAHELIAPGAPAYEIVVAEFGRDCLRPDGTIDRPRLARVVFADPKLKARLESILHPLIRAEEERLIEQLRAGRASTIAVVNAALLIEAGFAREYHRLVVVHCAPEIQVERIMRRDSMTREEALARIALQMPSAEKLKAAHYGIDTTGGFEATEARAREVFRHLQHDLVALSEGASS